MAIKIEGVSDALKVFEHQPQNAKKVSSRAMKDAVRAGTREMKRSAPARFKALVKGKNGLDSSLDSWASIGYYNTKVSQGHQPKGFRGAGARGGISDWFKFYWNDYGTLSLRDPSHKFTRPVKKNVKARRNNVGIPPRGYFDRAIPSVTQRFNETYQDSVEKNKDKLLEQ